MSALAENVRFMTPDSRAPYSFFAACIIAYPHPSSILTRQFSTSRIQYPIWIPIFSRSGRLAELYHEPAHCLVHLFRHRRHGPAADVWHLHCSVFRQRVNALKYRRRTCWIVHGKIQKHGKLGSAIRAADPAEKRLATVGADAKTRIITESE